jgi:TolB protein
VRSAGVVLVALGAASAIAASAEAGPAPRRPTTPAWATASQIVFAAVNGVFAVRADGSRLRRLSRLGDDTSSPSPSPRGVVAFSSYEGLWTVPVAGGKVTRLRRGPSVQATFSPGGSHLAFSSLADLRVIRSDGRGPRRVERYVTDLGAWPSWSPDGRRLAYMTCVSPGSPACENAVNQAVYVVNRDGTGKRRASARSGAITCVSWDGPRILYQWDHSDVYVTGRGGDRRVFRGAQSCPVWSPDGRHIAVFTRSGLALVTPAGRARTVARFTGAVSPPAAPAFSPDGKRLAFVRAFVSGRQVVYVVPATGGRPRRVA